MAVEPFKIDVSDSVLDDLRARLERTRWPDELPGTGWDYGSNLDYIKELVEYWRTKFDWRAQEKLINSFSHFKTKVDGLGIHFIHEKGKGPNPMPLVITTDGPELSSRCIRSSLCSATRPTTVATQPTPLMLWPHQCLATGSRVPVTNEGSMFCL